MKISIRDVIQKVIQPAGIGHLESTVDTLKIGDPDEAVRGIAVAFMPTQQVLEQAARLGANLIITHEGLYYHHQDSFENELTNDPVYEEKKQVLLESKVAVFRLHDYIHRYEPDGIMEGLLDALGWRDHVTVHQRAASVVQIPSPSTVKEMAEQVKHRLGLSFVRVVGSLDMPCRRIGLLAGFRGGASLTLPLFEQEQVDLIIYGEGPEWETPEYVRDAVHQGRDKALIVLGHAESEAAGMRLLAVQLQRQWPDVPIHFIPVPPIYQII